MVMSEYKPIKANVAKVKEHLSAYLTKVEKGDRIVVCRRNRPVAEIVPVEGATTENRTKLGSAKRSVKVKCDLTDPAISQADWDALQ